MSHITESIIATMRQPVLVLDQDLSVVTANPAFLEWFNASLEEAIGLPLGELGNGRWAIPELLRQLEEVRDSRSEIRDFRVEHDFQEIGQRVMLINARYLPEDHGPDQVLVAIEDITERERDRWLLEGEKEFAGKVVDASREALLILGWDLRVKSANQTFYETFQVDPGETEGRLVYELGDGQWDIPRLRELLEDVLPENNTFNDFEVEHDFPDIGHKTMLLNARKIDHLALILLAIDDVTERKRSIEALKSSEERLSAILEHVPIGVGLMDREGHWLHLNPEMRRFMGTRLPSRDPEAAHRWQGFDEKGHPVDPSQYPGARALRGEPSPPAVDFRTDITGEPRWVRFRAAPLPSTGGSIEEAVAVLQDITEEKRVQEALRASEARYRLLFNSIDEGFCIIKVLFDDANKPVDYAFLEVNEAFERQSGLSDAVGKTMRSLEPRHEEHWFEIYGNVALSRKAARFERPAEALRRYFDVYAFPMDEPRKHRVGILFRDIAERKRAEQALHASEERLRQSEARLAAALKAGNLGVYDYDPQANRSEWDARSRSLWGIPDDEVITYQTYIEGIHPDDVASVEKAIADASSPNGSHSYEIEYRVIHRETGEVRWVRSEGEALFEDGKLVRRIGIVGDITDRKQSERERDVLAHELAHRVKNTLAVVQSLATQTEGNIETIKDYKRAFLGRLQALAQAQSLLMDATWQSASLKELIEQTTQAFHVDHPSVIELVGEEVTVTAKQAQGLTLILHELGTNAAKYGALSRHEGRLRIAWWVEDTDTGRQVGIEWRERHGPEVKPPESKGFGTELIEGASVYELDGEARLDYAPEGLTCRIRFPLEKASS